MKPSKKITCKISEECNIMAEVPGFGVTETTLKNACSSWSFLQRYSVKIGNVVWHGLLTELPPEADNFLMVNKRLAHAIGIKKPTKAVITSSIASEIQTIQYEQVDRDSKESLPKAVNGFQIQIGSSCQFKGKNIKITACDPSEGYVTTSTYWEDINQEPGDDQENLELVVEQLASEKPARSSSGFDKLVGMDSIIQEVKHKIVLPYKNPDLAKKYLQKPLKGALISGPNGVGKTALARAIAEEVNVPMIHLPSGVNIESILKVYEKASRKKEGCIVFIDEIDGLLKTGSYGTQGNPFVTALQECIDGYIQNEGIFTIATTNFPDGLPDGLKRSGRFDVIINVGLPDCENRQKLFEFFLRGLKVSSDVDHKGLAEMTDIYTGSDIAGVVKEAGINAFAASQRNPNAKIISKRLVRAINDYNPTGSRIMALKKPQVSFDDIYGQNDLIKSITPELDVISGKKKAKFSSVSNEAILLHGPSGTGKTYLAQAIADYLGVMFLYQSGASFKSKWVGETEQNIRKMFANARIYKPVLIFIDEIDGIGKKRTGSDSNRHSEDALGAFLTEMEGIAGNAGIYIIGATNVPSDLDAALLSRFRRKFEMPKPNTVQRRAILKGLFDELPEEIVQVNYDKIASATKDYTHRHLKGLYDEVCLKLDIGNANKVTTIFLQSLISKNN